MRLGLALWLALFPCLAEAQVVVPINQGTAIHAPGSQAASGLSAGEIDLIYSVGNVDGGGSVEFGVCAVDPLNPSHAATCATSPAILVATGDAGVVTLSAPHSSSVVVSWAIDGGFYAPVWLSVQGMGSPASSFSSSGGGGGGAQDAGVYLIGPTSILAVIDGGFPPAISTVGSPGFVCCGTTFTAIPYSLACFSGTNIGPNDVFLTIDGGTSNEGYLVQAFTGGYGLCSTLPWGCISPGGAQVDGGCLSELQTNQ